jgi:hypothetical protein
MGIGTHPACPTKELWITRAINERFTYETDSVNQKVFSRRAIAKYFVA